MPITFRNFDKKGVANRMKKIRKVLKIYQKDLADSLGVSAASLSDIETGKSIPRHDVIYNLSKKYNISIYYLLHGEGEMFQSDSVKREIESGVYGIHTEFLKEFYRYYNESSIVRYEMMGFFRTMLLEKDKLIEKDIRLNEIEQAKMCGVGACFCAFVQI
jgi:transcriptional regulator with XRE-family HTH domain